MTDKLIILNKKGNEAWEGFMKHEDGKTMTVGFKGSEGKISFIADSFYGEFLGKNYFRYSSETLPKNIGIFLIKDGFGYLVLFYGDESLIKKNFTRLSGIEAKNEIPAFEEIKETKTETEAETEQKEPEYKETGYVLPEEFIQPPKEIPNTFFDCNKEKFNEILYNNPPNENLKMLIPDSKWVDVEEENYTFGIIYDENASPLYICYGFNLGWSEEAPESLEGYSQWIPLDYNDPHGDGLWMIYINAQTGERLK